MEWCSKANHEILNSKHQTGAPPAGWGLRRRNLRVSGVNQLPGVRFQVSEKRNIEAETCWSEAEIPSEAKRQRGTLNTETSSRSQSLTAKPSNSDLAQRTKFTGL